MLSVFPKSSVALRILPVFRHHEREWQYCYRCDIGRHAQHKVYFRGQLPCDVLFVGEGPGKDEDREGKPFVGKSGEMLQEWIYAVEMWMRIDLRYAITNTVLCRPTDKPNGANRPPTDTEKGNCLTRLMQFVDIAKPKLLVTVGSVARDWLTVIKFDNGSLLGFLPEVPRLHLVHPAYFLRGNGTGDSEAKKLVAFLERNQEVLQ